MNAQRAGLAIALSLARAGRPVRILEKRPILRDKPSSWRDRDGDILESGLHAFFGGYACLLALLDEIGIDGHLLWQPHTLTCSARGLAVVRAVPQTPGAAGFYRTSALSAKSNRSISGRSYELSDSGSARKASWPWSEGSSR
ncbi:MAG: FAD-dependent oxidoreductase [Vulcanimicrobiaceae bacterium]